MCRATSTSDNSSGGGPAGSGFGGVISGGGGNGSSVRSRFASVGTSTRIDSLQHMQAASSSCTSSHSKRKSLPAHAAPSTGASGQGGPPSDNRRPLQHVEKTCSFVMAALFLLFNALYWPWLLRDQDFDYAKFSATHQEQLKL